MASMARLEVVDNSSTPIIGNSANYFDKAPTQFSTILASVVGLEVIDNSSTPRKW